MRNPYLPYPVRIDDITVETEDKNLKTFKFVFLNPADEQAFSYKAGQFAELSVTGKGEIPIGIASSPTEKGFVMFTVNKVGLVSSFLHSMKVGRRHGHARADGQLVSRGSAWRARTSSSSAAGSPSPPCARRSSTCSTRPTAAGSRTST